MSDDVDDDDTDDDDDEDDDDGGVDGDCGEGEDDVKNEIMSAESVSWCVQMIMMIVMMMMMRLKKKMKL